MTKLAVKTFFILVAIALIGSIGCQQTPTVSFHPFKINGNLTYEDLVEGGFYPLPKQNNMLSRVDGNRQLVFELDPDGCLPNIMNDGLHCPDFKLKNRVFIQYFEHFDSTQIANYIDNYGGSISSKWKTDITDFNSQNTEWYFPISFENKKFIGQVQIQTDGAAVLNLIYSPQGVSTNSLSHALNFRIRTMAKEVLK